MFLYTSCLFHTLLHHWYTTKLLHEGIELELCRSTIPDMSAWHGKALNKISIADFILNVPLMVYLLSTVCFSPSYVAFLNYHSFKMKYPFLNFLSINVRLFRHVSPHSIQQADSISAHMEIACDGIICDLDPSDTIIPRHSISISNHFCGHD